jgi:putative (di)nucleoside polyphosphate hydrolase
VSSQHFRAGVVIVIRHPDLPQVLAFERADEPGSWQLPQGGMEPGEEPIEAAWRELAEETGLGAADVVVRSEYPHWVAYEWPAHVRAEAGKDGKRRGQVQRWFVFEAASAGISPSPDGSEFTAWKWVSPDWLISQVIAWRRDAYERVLATL